MILFFTWYYNSPAFKVNTTFLTSSLNSTCQYPLRRPIVEKILNTTRLRKSENILSFFFQLSMHEFFFQFSMHGMRIVGGFFFQSLLQCPWDFVLYNFFCNNEPLYHIWFSSNTRFSFICGLVFPTLFTNFSQFLYLFIFRLSEIFC